MTAQNERRAKDNGGAGSGGGSEAVNVGVVLCDPTGNVLHVDDAAAAIMGLDPGSEVSDRIAAWEGFEAGLLDPDGQPLPVPQSPLRLALATGEAVRDRVVVVPNADGTSVRWLQVTAELLRQDAGGGVSGVVLVHVDVTPLRLAPVTPSAAAPETLLGLADRATLEQRLDALLVRAPGEQLHFAVVALGVDRFKNVHDTLGHTVTEQIERQIAERLLRDLREDDTVARSGEGDLVLLLAGTASSTDVARTVERLKSSFDRRWEVAGREIFLTASVGIAVYPDDGADGKTLLKNAGTAMRQAQTAGGNTWHFYQESMKDARTERLGMESALHRALELQHFILDFQPQIDSFTGGVVGVEALLRWRDPERGIIPPGEFIPLAEETGLMLPIGAWVLEAACEQAMEWNPDPETGVRMAVNISPRQFEQQDIVGLVRQTLAMSGLPAPLLEIEITESMAIADPERTIALLNGLKQLGVRVALDDFGTGYSSLSHLARLPIDTVKIDRSFVSKLQDAREHIVVATSVIALGHRLGLTVVAEGVETHEQAAFLGNESCDVLQGFLFSRPVSPEKCADLIGGESAFAELLEESAARLADLMGSGGFGKQ